MTNKLRPNEQRGRYAIATMWLILGLNIFILLFNISIFIVNKIISENGYASESTYYLYKINFFISRFTTLLYLTVIITSIITFIKWFRRAYYNLGILTNECAYDDSWATKGWFIPIMNLYIPYRIMMELYEKTDKYLWEKHIMCEHQQEYEDKLKPGLVKWWWTLYLIVSIGVYGFQFIVAFFAPESTYDIIRVLIFSIVRTSLLILLGIVTVLVMKNYQKAEPLLI
ncbi:DUF4328 domain-containing protein [Prevotella sp. 10(H)]|uniref:DUF4328 domain-containing protein n=1 Tax=Prevotella sp. 10(H) TaxID=1158294 RepID=UPI0004A6D786|nr:DUF4328 domain-containing protein [Prevotella sp. 10(H)]